jgi:hypothetical protein
MANSLLDFVMALVRDPEAAARYAADPAGALAVAQLPGVTIADVNNLIPVVTDSLAAATPGFGVPTDGGPTTANIWASGAAAAAFDAFDIDIPPDLPPGIPPAEQSAPTISVAPVQVPADPVEASLADAMSAISSGGDDPVVPQSFGGGGGEDGGEGGWQLHPYVDPQPEAADPPRFDLS